MIFDFHNLQSIVFGYKLLLFNCFLYLIVMLDIFDAKGYFASAF